MAEDPFNIKTNLGPVLADLKAISPKIATGYRRAMRQAGDAVITGAREALANKPVGGVVTKTTYSLRNPSRPGGVRTGPRAKALAGARIVAVESRAAAKSRSRGTRATIASQMKTRVSISQKRGASVKVQTTTPGSIDVAFNAKTWRHPVFRSRGTAPFVEQAGNQFFQEGIRAGGRKARAVLQQTVADAMATIKQHPPE